MTYAEHTAPLSTQSSTQRALKLPATKHRRHRRRVHSLLHSLTRHDALSDGLNDDVALSPIKKERVVRDDLRDELRDDLKPALKSVQAQP